MHDNVIPLQRPCLCPLLDERYHDHLPADTNCRLCGVEHPAIHPELLGRNRA